MKIEKEMRMATIISGKHKGQTGCVMVEFTDGECIMDMGRDVLIYEQVSNLNLWVSVKSLELRDGKIFGYVLCD